MNYFSKFLSDDSGATAIEYALIASASIGACSCEAGAWYHHQDQIRKYRDTHNPGFVTIGGDNG
jgi:hypothetical protein